MYILGLGNPGSAYRTTRHNVGFLFCDFVARQCGGGVWHEKAAWYADTMTIGDTILVKPKTFMNDSGKTLRAIKGGDAPDRFGARLLIVHDDKDIALGEYKVQTGVGAAGHNGVRSVLEVVEQQYVTRLRIGVQGAHLPRGEELADYVLAPLSEDELRVLEELFERIMLDPQFLRYVESPR